MPYYRSKQYNSYKYLNQIFLNEGFLAFFYCLVYLLINRFFFMTLWKFFIIDESSLQKKYLKFQPDMEGKLLKAIDMQSFAENSIYEISPAFLERALTNNDVCYVVMLNDQLINYSWFSSKPTHMFGQYYIDYDSQYKFGYKAFTLIDFRGRKLNRLGTTNSANKIIEDGYKGLIVHIDAHNYSSIRSIRTMGGKYIGAMGVCRLGSRYLSIRSTGCRRFKCRLIKISEPTQ